jgi:rod shape-determining protein MreC
MAMSRRTGRSRFTLVACVVISIVAITLDYRGSSVIDSLRGGALDVVGPVRDAAGTATEPLTDAWNGITGYDDLQAENDRLQAQVDDLNRRLLDGADAEQRYQQLVDLLDVDGLEDLQLTPARVVASSSSNFDLTVEIDRGTDDGVADGQPVLAGRGLLVGHIVQAAHSRSSVRVVTDPNFAVGVVLPASGAVGTLRGEGRDRELTVAHLQPTAQVNVGDLVRTSGGAGSAFPPDLIVGTVTKVERSPGAATLDVWVTPAAPVGTTAYVQVVHWEPTP